MNRANAHDFTSLTKYTDDYGPGALRYNVGETSFFLNMPILKASLTQIKEWGVNNIQEYAGRIGKQLDEYFKTHNLDLFSDKYLSRHLLGVDLSQHCDMIKLCLLYTSPSPRDA